MELVVDATCFAAGDGGKHRAIFTRIVAAIRAVMLDSFMGRLANQLISREAQHPTGGGIHESDSPSGIHAK